MPEVNPEWVTAEYDLLVWDGLWVYRFRSRDEIIKESITFFPMNGAFDASIGDPDTWSDEKWEAIKTFFRKNRRWPTKEITVCLGCGHESPCDMDCPCGSGKKLV